MSALKQLWSVTRVVGLVLFAAGTSPIARVTALFYAVFLGIAFGLVVLAGGSKDLLWRLALPLLLLSIALAFKWALSSKSKHIEGPEVYDKAKYHYDGDYPKGLPRKQAFVHTGMFVGWLIDHDLIAADFLEETQGFKERKVTGAQVYRRWDGCLTSDMLTEEGRRFASDYFDFEHGQFLEDYDAVLVKDLPSQLHVADTWENYESIKRKIDERYAVWRQKQRKGAA